MVRTSQETIEKRFLTFICRKAVEILGSQFCGLTGLVVLTANLLYYLDVLNIEGEIALLSLYCNNFYTAHHRRTHRKKYLYALSAFCIKLKRIINSAYIFFLPLMFFSFLSGHKLVNEAFATTLQNRRAVNLFLKIISVTL